MDSFQKRFLMDMQLRQCVSRSKPFRLKKSQKKSDFVWLFFISKKSQRCSKKARISKYGFKKAKLATLNPSINDPSTTTTAFCCNGARPLHARKIGQVQGYFPGEKAPEKEMRDAAAQACERKCLRTNAGNNTKHLSLKWPGKRFFSQIGKALL